MEILSERPIVELSSFAAGSNFILHLNVWIPYNLLRDKDNNYIIK